MRIVIITVGSVGDTAPYVGLGVRLKAAGHDVAIAAQSCFSGMVQQAGLEFCPMPGDIRADLTSENGQRLQRASSWVQAIPAQIALATKMMTDVASGIVGASVGAELLIVHRPAMKFGHVVAKTMGIPSMTIELFPSGISPTGDFLPILVGGGSLGPWFNRAVYRLLRARVPDSGPLVDLFRDFQSKLGQPRRGFREMYALLDEERWPIYHAFSPALVPRPADWRAGLEVVGYLWPAHMHEWQPPADLVDFLEAGPPPVFIGFGSVCSSEAGRLADLVHSTVQRAKVRAVVQAGWSGLTVQSEQILSIGSVPHDWLFPKMAAVVHAAGAGTTGAGLRAGVPAVPVPVCNDQPFWAHRLVELGVSPGAVRFQKLTAKRLAALIREAVTCPVYRLIAEPVAARIAKEDGAGYIVAAVNRLAG